MTYSILGYDASNSDLGVAVQSKFPGVGSLVPYGEAEVGVVATQRVRKSTTRICGLMLLRCGATPQQAVDVLLNDDSLSHKRQFALVGKEGAVATHTGAVGIDCPPVVGSATAIVPRARARLNLRIPPGVTPERAAAALVHHLHEAAPWRVRVAVDIESSGDAFRPATDAPAYRAMTAALRSAYASPVVELGQGGSIPLCGGFATTYPEAEIILIGVEEPLSLIHAPNESVHPNEIADMALAEALFLQNYAAARR